MKFPIILFLMIGLFFVKSDLQAQDPTFSQWENMPLYFNPALTGDFEGTFRFRVKYRDQWRSVLDDGAFRTGVGSAEYKFKKGDKRKLSLGYYSVYDKAGETRFTTTSNHISTSVVQNLGNLEESYHSIAVGIDFGIERKKIDLEGLSGGGVIFPIENLIDKVSYFDLAAGLNWKYHTKTHFSAQVGVALSHLNRPNESFSGMVMQRVSARLNLHGNIELPLGKQISILPSFLYQEQGPSNQLLFGLAGKWYLKEASNNFLKLGFFGKLTQNFNGKSINVYVGSASIEINGLLFGFSYDRFNNFPFDSSAYEFSVGYIIGQNNTKSN